MSDLTAIVANAKHGHMSALTDQELKRVEAAEHWAACAREKRYTLTEWHHMLQVAVMHIEALAEIARSADTQDLPAPREG